MAGAKKYSFKTVIFDLDGVITKTAVTHAAAWKETFDGYLRLREKRDGEPFKEFDHGRDYLPYVDGKPRYDGVKSFLESRGINIPYGDPSDAPDKETVCGLGNNKNIKFVEVLERDGAEVYQGTVDFINELRAGGVRIGVASSSKNCEGILKSAKLDHLFETRVDGVVSEELGLKGKPEGDIFVTAARNLGAMPAESVVVEDATSGVAAGRNGGFGFVLGVARKDNRDDLFKNGADAVVKDLSGMTAGWVEQWFHRKPLPFDASWDKADKDKLTLPDDKAGICEVSVNPCYTSSAKEALFRKKEIAFFLDYDGTLTPIVDRPDLAVIAPDMRSVVTELSKKCLVAIVSGRMRQDVENLVGINELIYAGSHGFDIKGPGISMTHPEAEKAISVVNEVIAGLTAELGDIPNIIIEKKKFSTAAHYRMVDEGKYLSRIETAVKKAVAKHKSLRLMSGKKVFEILPNIDWDKGKAVRWVVEALKIDWEKTSVVYIGDDVTDEDAFRAVRTRGTGILVSEKLRPSTALFDLRSPADVKKLFEKVLEAHK
ncbi:MAG: trehalose-phosphatase [Candidatus Omnitrophota bacterium]